MACALEPLEIVEGEGFDVKDVGDAIPLKSKTPEWESEFQSWHSPPSDVVRHPDKNNFQIIPSDTPEDLQARPALLGSWETFQGAYQSRMRYAAC